MELNRSADGSTAPLAARNIDTGLGLERMAQILQARRGAFCWLVGLVGGRGLGAGELGRDSERAR